MEKHYLSANEYLEDAWALAAQIRRANWRPDLIIALWRGGAPVGVAVHEFLKFTGWPLSHFPLKCASYSGIGENFGAVEFALSEPLFKTIKKGDKVLVVDDVFDTGKTAAAVKSKLDATGAESRFATVYFKSEKNQTSLKPDYFVREVGGEWLVFPHELEGLSREEVSRKNPTLAQLID